MLSDQVAGRDTRPGSLTMVLLQISEPGEPTADHHSRQIALGIDLGTTNSLVAHFDGTETQVLMDDAGRAALRR